MARKFAGTGTSPRENQRGLQQRFDHIDNQGLLTKGGGFIRDLCIRGREEVLRALVERRSSTSFAVAISFAPEASNPKTGSRIAVKTAGESYFYAPAPRWRHRPVDLGTV